MNKEQFSLSLMQSMLDKAENDVGHQQLEGYTSIHHSQLQHMLAQAHEYGVLYANKKVREAIDQTTRCTQQCNLVQEEYATCWHTGHGAGEDLSDEYKRLVLELLNLTGEEDD